MAENPKKIATHQSLCNSHATRFSLSYEGTHGIQKFNLPPLEQKEKETSMTPSSYNAIVLINYNASHFPVQSNFFFLGGMRIQ